MFWRMHDRWCRSDDNGGGGDYGYGDDVVEGEVEKDTWWVRY